MGNFKELFGFRYDDVRYMMRDLRYLENLGYTVYGYYDDADENKNVLSISWQDLVYLRKEPHTPEKNELRKFYDVTEFYTTTNLGQTIIRSLEAREIGEILSPYPFIYEPLGKTWYKLDCKTWDIIRGEHYITSLKLVRDMIDVPEAILRTDPSYTITLSNAIITLINRGWIDVSEDTYKAWEKEVRGVQLDPNRPFLPIFL